MKYCISPGDSVHGVIEMPGDKSISHRAVLLAAISDHPTTIFNISLGTDVLASIDAMRALGVSIKLDKKNKTAFIEGVGLNGLKAPQKPIDCSNSGTLMRLLTGLLAGQNFNSVLIGDASLSKRPMLRIANPLREMGANIVLSENNTAPIHITGAPLKGISYESPIASAQVKSAVLLAGLYATGETKVLEKIKTRDHTERMLSMKESEIKIPGDISAAAFFIVLATITKESELRIFNVGVNPCRTGVLTILKLMGANITLENQRFYNNEPVADIHVTYTPLNGIFIPDEFIASAIDEFPILFIAAAIAKGKTVLRNAKELRVKESDRISVMVENLRKLGVSVVEFEDGVEIEGGHKFSGGILDAKQDHRIAMALAVAGHVANSPIAIQNCDLVNTSFPKFTETMQDIGVQIS